MIIEQDRYWIWPQLVECGKASWVGSQWKDLVYGPYLDMNERPR